MSGIPGSKPNNREYIKAAKQTPDKKASAFFCELHMCYLYAIVKLKNILRFEKQSYKQNALLLQAQPEKAVCVFTGCGKHL